jgi:hypothetical protein
VPNDEVRNRLAQRLVYAVGAIRFVGSPEVTEAAEKVLDTVTEEMAPKQQVSGYFIDALELFHVAARKDLGHPM